MNKHLENILEHLSCLAFNNEGVWTDAIDEEYEQIKQEWLKDEDFIAIENALTELTEIKKVVENWDDGEYYTDSIHSMKKIEDILKGGEIV